MIPSIGIADFMVDEKREELYIPEIQSEPLRLAKLPNELMFGRYRDWYKIMILFAEDFARQLGLNKVTINSACSVYNYRENTVESVHWHTIWDIYVVGPSKLGYNIILHGQFL